MAENYSTDEDLIKIRPNIMGMGYDEYDDQHTEAKAIIDRDIDTGWYRQAASERADSIRLETWPSRVVDFRTVPFDPDKLTEPEELKRLSCYKALELVYAFLSKDIPDDGFAGQRDYFKKKYDEELESVLTAGITYDWAADGVDAYDKQQTRSPRRLRRC